MSHAKFNRDDSAGRESGVVRGVLLQRKCDCGNHTMSGNCDDCAKKKSSLQRKSTGNTESSGVPSVVHEVLRSPGQPLDVETRAFFEPRFGHNFSQVRVHTDAQAAESARVVNAKSYTAGNHVVFRDGYYSPHTKVGRELIAHEMTHVIQQAGMFKRSSTAVGPKVESASEDARFESEADETSKRIMRDEHRTATSSSPQPSATDTFQIQRAAISSSQPRPRTRAGTPHSESDETEGSEREIAEEHLQGAPDVGSKKPAEKTPCAKVSEKDRGKGSSKNISPWQEGWDWLTGQHEPTRYFGLGDQMTDQLRNHEAVVAARTNATSAIEAACARDSHSAEVNDEHGINYELGGVEGIAKYVRDYSTLATFGLTGNLTATFLGSYHGCWNASMECCDGKATLHFHITNRSGLTSATHLPVLGYDRPRPTISDWLTNPIQTGQQWGPTLPGSIVSNVESGGPMSTVEQVFDWEEPVLFSPPKACSGSTVKKIRRSLAGTKRRASKAENTRSR